MNHRGADGMDERRFEQALSHEHGCRRSSNFARNCLQSHKNLHGVELLMMLQYKLLV